MSHARGSTRCGSARSSSGGRWFAALDERLATVELNGEPAFLLAEDVDDLGAISPTDTVRLLPGFDQYVLGPGTKAEEIIAPARRAEVSRTAGWISPVIVAGGRVVGIWEVAGRTIKVRLFAEADRVPDRGDRSELVTHRLGNDPAPVPSSP